MSSAKRAILIPQKTNIRLDLESLANANALAVPTLESKSRRPSLGKTPIVSTSVNIEKTPSLSRPSSLYPVPLSARTTEDALAESRIAQFLEDVPTVGLTKEDSKVLRTRVIEEMYRIQQRQQITPEERQRLYQLAISMDAPKLARKLVAEVKDNAEETSSARSTGSDDYDNHSQPVSSFLTGEYHIPSQRTPKGQNKNSNNSALSPRAQSAQQPSRSYNTNDADEDDLFCKAFDEVERIRQRMIQRVNTATVTASPTMPMSTAPHSARQPLTGRRLSGDTAQNIPMRNPNTNASSTSHLHPRTTASVHPTPATINEHSEHHHHHPSRIPVVPSNERRKSISPKAGSSSTGSTTTGSAHKHTAATGRPSSAQKHSQLLHDLLTPRSPSSHDMHHGSSSSSSHQRSGGSHGSHQQSHLFLSPNVDSEPSLNVHEALDSILGSRSHANSQPNSRSLSGHKKSALSSYHRILAAADAQSDDSRPSSDGEGMIGDDDDNDEDSESEHDSAQVVDLSTFGNLRQQRNQARGRETEEEVGGSLVAISASDDPYERLASQHHLHLEPERPSSQYHSNHSSLDSESRRALEGLRKHDSHHHRQHHKENNQHSQHHQQQSTSHKENNTTMRQKPRQVPPLQSAGSGVLLPHSSTINSNGNYAIGNEHNAEVAATSARRPSSATRLAPLQEPLQSSHTDSTTTATVASTTSDHAPVISTMPSTSMSSAIRASSVSNRGRQHRVAQPISAGYLIASPLSDWIHASNGLTPLPPLSASVSTASLHHPQLQSQPSSHLTSALVESGAVLRPQASLYTPSIGGHAHVLSATSGETSGPSSGSQSNLSSTSSRDAPLRRSRFTFTPQETSDDNNNTQQPHQHTNLQPQYASMAQNPLKHESVDSAYAAGSQHQRMWDSLEMFNSSQHPDWQNLKRSLELLKDHMTAPSSTTAASATDHAFFSDTSPATPSHIALSGLSSPMFQQLSQQALSQQGQSHHPPLQSQRSTSSSTAHMLLQQSLKRPVALNTQSSASPHSDNGNGNGIHSGFHAHTSQSSSSAATNTTAVSPRPGQQSEMDGLQSASTGLKKTSSFRHAGDLLMARNIVDAATNHGIAQQAGSAFSGVASSGAAVASSSNGMPPLRREGSVTFTRAPSLLQQPPPAISSGTSSTSNTPTPSTHASSVSNLGHSTASSANLTGPNINSSRMFALAAALDAGDAVGKLMADMLMHGTPTSAKNHHLPSIDSGTLRLATTPANKDALKSK